MENIHIVVIIDYRLRVRSYIRKQKCLLISMFAKQKANTSSSSLCVYNTLGFTIYLLYTTLVFYYYWDLLSFTGRIFPLFFSVT